MSRFDSHIHLFEHGYSGAREAGDELADYMLLRSEFEISNALVVGYEGESRFSHNTDYILKLASEHTWIHPLAYLDPYHPIDPGEAALLLDAGATGFSLYLGDDGRVFDAFDPSLWRLLNERAAFLSLNVTPRGLDGCAAIIRTLSNATVLLSHLGLPGGAARADAANTLSPVIALADQSNVVVKFSGLYAIDPNPPHTEARSAALIALTSFGADRMLWGSDFAPGLEELRREQLFAAPPWFIDEVSTSELALILGGNLDRILGVGAQ